MVYRVGELHHLRLGHPEDVAQLGQGVPGLLGGDIESHRNLGGVLGKVGQLLQGDSSLAGGSGDLGQLSGGAGNLPREGDELLLQHLGAQRRGELHHLLDVGEGRLELDGGPGRQTDWRSDSQRSRGQRGPHLDAVNG